jgi:hypothetical protein
MNPYEKLIRAFEIFQAAGDVGEGIAAEHDVICAGPPAEQASAEQRAELERLGWHAGIDEDGFYHFV